jgi:hypothetical protein
MGDANKSLRSGDSKIVAGNKRSPNLRLTRGRFYVWVLVRFIEWKFRSSK